jgi:hypothetical protein
MGSDEKKCAEMHTTISGLGIFMPGIVVFICVQMFD